MSVVATILSPDKIVPPEVKKQRMQKCDSCEHKVKLTGSCGTLILGGTVNHNGFPVNLCGCIVSEKTELKNQSCPLGKWNETA